MTKEEKITLLWSLLHTIESISNNSDTPLIDADSMLAMITAWADEEQLDSCIVVVTETLEKIWIQIQNTKQEIQLLEINDMEVSDTANNKIETDTLLNYF